MNSLPGNRVSEITMPLLGVPHSTAWLTMSAPPFLSSARMALPPRDEPTIATLRRRVALRTCTTKEVSSFIWSSAEDRNGWGLESSLRAFG